MDPEAQIAEHPALSSRVPLGRTFLVRTPKQWDVVATVGEALRMLCGLPRELDGIHWATEGLRALGYVDGKNLILEWRSADARFERYPEIIRELVSTKVDVIVTASNTVTRAAREVTQTIPIVVTGGGAYVEEGWAQSLARPGGNISGLTSVPGFEIIGKRLQLRLHRETLVKNRLWPQRMKVAGR
jgi:ABC transporter substrate binding protein